MTLTEEQREAIRAVSDLPRAIGCTQCHSYIQEHYGNQFAILRAMIDSGDRFGEPNKMMAFDLEKVRAVLEEAIDRMSLTVSDEDGPIWEADPEQTAILQEMLDRIGRYTNNDYLDLQYQLDSADAEIERLRAALAESEKIVEHKSKSATHWYDEHLSLQTTLTQSKRVVEQQAARIKELEADLEQSERVIEAKLDAIDQQSARIKALEDALVEGLTNFLHYRASCYDPARRCPYAKECDDCSTWDACGHVEKFRSEARRLLQAEGKIGPGARPRSWQITEERKAALNSILEYISYDSHDDIEICGHADILRAMLKEAE